MLPHLDLTTNSFALENAYVCLRASQACYPFDWDEYYDRLLELCISRSKQRWIDEGVDACFVGWTDDFAMLAFRGTVSNVESWISNLHGAVPRDSYYFNFEVHRGFELALAGLWEPVLAVLREKAAGLPLFVTGHSRGGALATLAAHWLIDEGITPRAVYTFGCPRVGDKKFGTAYKYRRHYRVENDRDIIPHLPRFSYRHVGERCWLDSEGGLVLEGVQETPTLKVIEAAFADAAVGMLGHSSVVAASVIGGQGFLAEEFLSDHRATEYAYWLWNLLPEPARSDAAGGLD